MTPSRLILLGAALAMAGSVAAAQGVTHMTLKPQSTLSIAGSSNVHEWTCASTQYQAEVVVDSTLLTAPLSSVTHPINTVSVTIPVRSLKCGHDKMDDNMYKALNADKYPQITYTLASYEVDHAASTADAFTATTTGDITVSGRTVRVQIPITTTRGPQGALTGEGKVALKMTDFGIKPPTAMLGALRTKDDITISFKVLLDKSVVMALMQR